MGCDIHAFLEIKVNDEWLYYGQVDFDRNYEMFGKVAGVRGEGPPIQMPRGWPQDASKVSLLQLEACDGDDHHKSWLDATQLQELDDWCSKNQCVGFDVGHDRTLYVFGNSIQSWWEYPKQLRTRGVSDIRLLFFFDN